MVEHDFKNYPELLNSEMAELEFISPHPQIKEDFQATLVKVHDGDTITLTNSTRSFQFPLRFLAIDSKELNEGGEAARDWLKTRILNSEVLIKIDPNNRVDKYGRLLGKVLINGLDVGQEELDLGYALPFAQRNEGKIDNLNKSFNIDKWL